MECIICLEPLMEEGDSPPKETAATVCGHIFHYQCLIDWLPKDPSCPKCRQPVYNYQIRKVFLEGDSSGGGGGDKKNKECSNCPRLQSSIDNLTEANDFLRAQVMSLEDNQALSTEQIHGLNAKLEDQKNSKATLINSLTEGRNADREEIKRLRKEIENKDKKLHDLELHYVNLLRMKNAVPGKSVIKLKRLRRADMAKLEKKEGGDEDGYSSSSDSEPDAKTSRQNWHNQDGAEMDDDNDDA